MRSDDNIYFTDPDSGFYRISPHGTVSAAMKVNQVSRPNGIVLSPDENTLYVGDVGNTDHHQVHAGGRRHGDDRDRRPTSSAQTMGDTVDGMCVDCAGNVYAGTAAASRSTRRPAAYIGTVPTGESSNCTFGGADRKTMYVTRARCSST